MKKSFQNRLIILLFALLGSFIPITVTLATELTVNAKGTSAGGEYAHFRVYLNNQEIGDAYTSSVYSSYLFTFSLDYSAIEDVWIIFDNDKVIDGRDRNLYVDGININSNYYKAKNTNTTYLRSTGVVVLYNGGMFWNGTLMFSIPNTCESNLYITSQDQLDQIYCSDINGQLVISGEDINDLTSLSNIEYISGSLIISENPILKNLDGLESIKAIGGILTVSDNLALENIDGISGLTSINNTVQILNNPNLNNLNGLSGLDEIISLYIVNNDKLTNLDVFRNKNISISLLTIQDNAALTNLDGLSGLNSKFDLQIYNNSSLANIDGLSKFASFGTLTFIDNEALTNLDALSAVTTVNTLQISNNGSLTNLNGLSGLTEISGNLLVVDNPSLKWCCGLYSVLSNDAVGGTITIYNNGSGCTQTDIVEGGPCMDKFVKVKAKGTAAAGIFAHFKVIVDNHEIGNTFTTSEYENYAFSLLKELSLIQEIRIVFDNDAVINGRDRNLYIQSIEFGDRIIETPNDNITYYRGDGQEVNYYGTMWWRGELVFDLSNTENTNARSGFSYDVNKTIFEKNVDFDVHIYPNPAGKFMNIEMNNMTKGPIKLVLQDLTGKNVLSFDYLVGDNAEFHNINISQLPSGLYLINLLTGDQKRYVEKLVIE